jgi:hypothetical protein
MVRAVKFRIIFRLWLNILADLKLASRILVSMCGEFINSRRMMDMLRAIEGLRGSLKGILFRSCAFAGVACRIISQVRLH